MTRPRWKGRTMNPRTNLRLLVVPWLAVLTGCGGEPGAAPDATAASGGAGASAAGGAGLPGSAATGGSPGTSVNPLGRPRCTTPPGVSGSPHSIEEALALVNALPKPTSVACFVESLDRPLAAYATRSVTSAQPALSAASPRVFLNFDQLWFSIVIDGDASDLIEFGDLKDDMRSIKGELEGPFTDVVAPSTPYDRVRLDTGTVCGFCHREEQRADSVSFATAFESTALRPRPETHVSLDDLASANSTCDWSAEPHRCEMLSALFDGGPVAEREFPSSMPTFY